MESDVAVRSKAMTPQDPYFIAPPPTEVPDYIWDRWYDRPKDTARTISHPDAESALQAAKKACRAHLGRWFGRSSVGTGLAAFLVYEGGKVIERHVVGK